MDRRPLDHSGRDIRDAIESAIGAPFDCRLLVEPSALRFGFADLQETTVIYKDNDPTCFIGLYACGRCGQDYLRSRVGVYRDYYESLTPISEQEAAEAVALGESIRPGHDQDRAMRFARRLARNRPYIVQADMVGLAEGQRNPYKEWVWGNVAGIGNGLPPPLSYGPTL